jgi:hypothetical protein
VDDHATTSIEKWKDVMNVPNYRGIPHVEENIRAIFSIAPSFEFSEDSPPAKDILTARLRAKYYGAQNITYRTFLLKILENSGSGIQVSDNFRSDVEVPKIDVEAIQRGEIDSTTLHYARECMKALEKSTESFHGLGEVDSQRLIVTNIWGTAHAYVLLKYILAYVGILTSYSQWGNMLVLLAAFGNRNLGQFIERSRLCFLLVKTLKFLRFNAQKSSALYTDWKILRYAGEQAGLLPLRSSTNPNLSFNSTASGDVAMADR